MKRLLILLFFIPFLLQSQDTTSIEVCYHDQAYLQTYAVNDGPNQYYWNVEGGSIQGNATGNSIMMGLMMCLNQ